MGITKRPGGVKAAMLRRLGDPNLSLELSKMSILAWTNTAHIIQFVTNRWDPDHPQYLVSCGDIKITAAITDNDNSFRKFMQ
jgi:hypothetical protein